MSLDLLATIMFLAALLLAGIDLVRTRGEALTTWAVFLVALGLVLLRVL